MSRLHDYDRWCECNNCQIEFFTKLAARYPSPQSAICQLMDENERLRSAVLNAAGDDLCRFSQEEIQQMRLGMIKIPPWEEFGPSCKRFHDSMAAERGVLEGGKTIAQLEAENELLRGLWADSETAAIKLQIEVQQLQRWKEAAIQTVESCLVENCHHCCKIMPIYNGVTNDQS